MKRALENFLAQRVKSCCPSLLLCLLVLWSLPARAASSEHWTTNGTHKGILVEQWGYYGPLETNNFIGEFRVSYVMYPDQGEVVEDFLFYWDWPSDNRAIKVGSYTDKETGRQINVLLGDLAKYPDLKAEFLASSPVSLEIRGMVFFLGLGSDFKTLQSSQFLIEKAGVKPRPMVAGSPHWADFCESPALTREARAAMNKRRFLSAKEVWFDSPQITRIEWSYEPKAVVREYAKRENAARKTNVLAKATNAVPKTASNPFFASNTNAAANPFTQPAQTKSAPPGPDSAVASNPFNQEAPTANPFDAATGANPFGQATVAGAGENPFQTAQQLELSRQADASNRVRLNEQAVAAANQVLADAEAKATTLKEEALRLMRDAQALAEQDAAAAAAAREQATEAIAEAERIQREIEESASKNTAQSAGGRSGSGLSLTTRQPAAPALKWVEKTCEWCRGSGKCDSCGGKGGEAKTCDICGGTKQIKRPNPYGPARIDTCPYCPANGVHWYPCPDHCVGGKCRACGGRGKIKKAVPNP